MKTLVIKEKDWIRGGKSQSFLRNEKGRMCCLGFLAKKCGAESSEITGCIVPSDAPSIKWPKGTLIKDSISPSGYEVSSLIDDIVIINDDMYNSAKERKAKLRLKFKELGYRLVFK